MMSEVEDTVQDKTGQESGNPASGTGQIDQYQASSEPSSEVSVYNAADILGVTVDAIRKRVQRGTIPHRRDEGGRVWVILDDYSGLQDTAGARRGELDSGVPEQDKYQTRALLQAKDETIAELRDQVDYLRAIIETRDRELGARTEELRRRDIIISSITQRMPELPRVPPEETLNVPEGAINTPQGLKAEGYRASSETQEEDEDTPHQRHSWLVRFFFGP